MQSWEFYWDFFLSEEKRNVALFLGALQHPSSYYLWGSTFFVLAFLFVCELTLPWRRKQRRLRPGLGLDTIYVLMNAVLLYALFADAFTRVGLQILVDALHEYFGLVSLVAVKLDGMPMWSRFLLMFVVADLIGYFGHWTLHRVGFLWEFHKIHHSSRQLDVWNAQRFHFGEQLFWPFFNYIPMALIGFPQGEAFAASLLVSLFSNFTHANVKVPLGPLKYIINNPQIHIWHHAAAVDPRRNVNYGDALIVWDYLFGTAYRPAERDDLRLGFADIEDFPTSFWGQTVYPFKAIGERIWDRMAALAGGLRPRSYPSRE